MSVRDVAAAARVRRAAFAFMLAAAALAAAVARPVAADPSFDLSGALALVTVEPSRDAALRRVGLNGS